jgi:hypothetical protein
MWACTFSFCSFIMICIHLKCYTPSDVQLIMCVLCEKKWLKKFNAPKKEQNIIFLNVLLFFFFFFLINFFFHLCFDNSIKFYASHHYYTTHILWSRPIYTFTNMFQMTWVFIFQKRGKWFKHSNPIYLLSYLTKMKQKTKPFENEIIQKKLIKQLLRRYICEY